MAATGQGTGQGQAAAGGDAAQQGQADGQQQQTPGILAGLGFEQQAHQQLQADGQGDDSLRSFLGELGQQQQQWTQQAVQQALQAQQPAAPQVDLEALGLASGDPALDGQVTQQLTQAFQQFAEAREQQLMGRVEQMIGGVTERLDGFEHNTSLQDLAYKYPELQDPQAANAVMQGQQTFVSARLGHLGPEMSERLAREPAITELMYLALAAQSAHQAEEQQGSGDPGAATLEGGGGATPGGGQQGDAFDRMLASKRGSSVLPFG
jgi:hypothetical protein